MWSDAPAGALGGRRASRSSLSCWLHVILSPSIHPFPSFRIWWPLGFAVKSRCSVWLVTPLRTGYWSIAEVHAGILNWKWLVNEEAAWRGAPEGMIYCWIVGFPAAHSTSRIKFSCYSSIHSKCTARKISSVTSRVSASLRKKIYVKSWMSKMQLIYAGYSKCQTLCYVY